MLRHRAISGSVGFINSLQFFLLLIYFCMHLSVWSLTLLSTQSNSFLRNSSICAFEYSFDSRNNPCNFYGNNDLKLAILTVLIPKKKALANLFLTAGKVTRDGGPILVLFVYGWRKGCGKHTCLTAQNSFFHVAFFTPDALLTLVVETWPTSCYLFPWLGSQRQHVSCIEPWHAGYRSGLLSCTERGM